MKYNTDQTFKSAYQTIKMKQPGSHMRNGDFTGNSESSAVDVGCLGSDNIEPLYRTDRVDSHLSDRYRRRRASAQSVKFTLPRRENIAPKNKVKKNLTESLVADDEDDFERQARAYLDYRRMSAPELPPINGSGKNSGLINNGNLSSRSNTFHNYKFNLDNSSFRKSNYSDSSIHGYRLNSQSRTSSSSSKNSRTRVLSAGTDGRTYRPLEITKEKPLNPALKLLPPAMKNGISGMASRSGSVNGYRRSKSKISLNNNNNNKVTTPRKIKHVHSESNIRDVDTRSVKPSEISLKRNCSDKSLTDINKNNQNVVRNGRKKVTANGNLNGMRRFSSTLGLSTGEERKSDEGVTNGKDDYDSDSDSDKDQRVIEWIIGVNDVAEPPEEPDIEYHDEPPQRDTAIRIVYDGDS